MLTKNVIKITNIEEINSRVLQLQFNIEWTMDNTAIIIDYLVQTTAVKIMEIIQGADVHCVRIHCGASELLLNFEEYSHSCWLECATEQDIVGLQEIKSILS